jgi:hypothetical protein
MLGRVFIRPNTAACVATRSSHQLAVGHAVTLQLLFFSDVSIGQALLEIGRDRAVQLGLPRGIGRSGDGCE